MKDGSMIRTPDHARVSLMEVVLETQTTSSRGKTVKICVWMTGMMLKMFVTSMLMLALVRDTSQDGDMKRRLEDVSSSSTGAARGTRTGSCQ